MNIPEEPTLPQMDSNFDDLGFGPRIVNVNYNAYNCSVDSRYTEKPSSKNVSNMKVEKMANGGQPLNAGGYSKKKVRFIEKPETFLIKSYKEYNRTGKHKSQCLCRAF